MINTNKCFEYYLDSKIYGSEEIQKSIDETKKEFPKKNIKVYVSLNDYGMYVITFYFKSKKIIKQEENKIIKKEKTKKPQLSRLEKYYGENRYGQYQSQGVYRPY